VATQPQDSAAESTKEKMSKRVLEQALVLRQDGFQGAGQCNTRGGRCGTVIIHVVSP
jgi:hypothetical protein